MKTLKGTLLEKNTESLLGKQGLENKGIVLYKVQPYQFVSWVNYIAIVCLHIAYMLICLGEVGDGPIGFLET